MRHIRFYMKNIGLYITTNVFTEKMSKKYGLPVVRNMTKHPNNFVENRYLDFLKSWKDCIFHINLDPTSHYGLQATQCATLSTINIGGNNDANFGYQYDIDGEWQRISQTINLAGQTDIAKLGVRIDNDRSGSTLLWDGFQMEKNA